MVRSLKGIPIAMLGGDRRELELARALIQQGADLRIVGFPRDRRLEGARFFSDPLDAVEGGKAVLGPMSNTDLQGRIRARLDGGDPIDLTEVMTKLAPKTHVLLGVAKPIIKQLADQYRLQIIETAEIEEIAIYNAIPTAEGAIQVAMEETPITIHNSNCLVVGFGRCGLALTQVLMGLGAKVWVAARSKPDLARIYQLGPHPLPIEELFSATDFDFIFNTVPALILTRPYLRNLKSSALIVDIAAAPGGTDFAAAEEIGIRAILTLSLPGKVAPITAGKILTDCIPGVLKEVLGGEAGES